MPLIEEEWPQVQLDSLKECDGDLERTIDYIAAQSERTRTLVRLHLEELYKLANRSSAPDNGSGRSHSSNRLLDNEVTHKIDRFLDTLENRAEKILTQMETEVSQKAKENIGISLLAALGMGFILGLLFGGSNRGRS
jgi:hypothetical protein